MSREGSQVGALWKGLRLKMKQGNDSNGTEFPILGSRNSDPWVQQEKYYIEFQILYS